MKILILMILGIIYANISYGQQTQIKNAVVMSLPKSSEKMMKSMPNNKNSKSSIFSQKIAKDLDIYRIGGYPVLINAGEAKVKTNYLKELELDLNRSATSAKYSYYNSAIKKYNNFDVLIRVRESKYDTIGFINFFCVNKTNERCFNGQLEYPIGERANAEKVIEDLLNSTNFK
jgi:hypothetical protein